LKNRIASILGTGLLALVTASCAGKPAPESGSKAGSGSSLVQAAAIGAPVSAIVELSDLYRAPEIYDVKITVLEVLRGAAAMDLLKRASASNAPPGDGFEYVLARIRFEYAARGTPGDKTWELAANQFNAFSSDGAPYAKPPITLPAPALDGPLRSGDSREGWIAFAATAGDRKPVMTFSPGNVWFRLY
jgi:hypothetical protein